MKRPLFPRKKQFHENVSMLMYLAAFGTLLICMNWYGQAKGASGSHLTVAGFELMKPQPDSQRPARTAHGLYRLVEEIKVQKGRKPGLEKN